MINYLKSAREPTTTMKLLTLILALGLSANCFAQVNLLQPSADSYLTDKENAVAARYRNNPSFSDVTAVKFNFQPDREDVRVVTTPSGVTYTFVGAYLRQKSFPVDMWSGYDAKTEAFLNMHKDAAVLVAKEGEFSIVPLGDGNALIFKVIPGSSRRDLK